MKTESPNSHSELLIEQSTQIEAKLVKAELIVSGELSRKTKAQAFQEHVDSGQHLTQEDRIKRHLKEFGPHSRRELEETLGIRGSSCSARLNSLVNRGEVIESGTTECIWTEKTVVVYAVLTTVEVR